MMESTIVIEDAGSNYYGYVIGLDGCISTGMTVDETAENMREAIELHLEGMHLHGDTLPKHMPIIKTVQVES